VYPGPEIQATLIDNILAGDIIARPRWSRTFDLLAIVVLPVLVAVVLPRLSALGGLIFVVPLFALFVTVAYQLFVRAHVWLNMVYPTFALAGTYTMLTVYRYLTEERERRRISSVSELRFAAGDRADAEPPEHARSGQGGS
jgi:adenylate cyclase